MNEAGLVHPWTANWWGLIPSAYRDLDAEQQSPHGLYSVGLNLFPRFDANATGWTVRAGVQTETAVSVVLEQDFQDAEAGRELFVQAWWELPAAGASLTLSLYGLDGALLATKSKDSFAEVAGMEFVQAVVPELSGGVRVVVEVGGPVSVGPNQSFINLQAVNVAYRLVDFDILPEPDRRPAFPLLRFMDGPGRIAGQVRELSDLMWSGAFTDPGTAPDYAVRWLAQMLGVPKSQRELPVDVLRTYLVDLVQTRPAAGNRQSIALAAKRFLTGDRQALVVPSTVAPHTILVLVRTDEVPGNNTAVIATGIRAAGVIPAGHDLQVVLAESTWDSWEAAAGVTWTELEAKAPTWAKGDSLGIQLE